MYALATIDTHPTFGETVSVEISIDVERFIGGFVMLGTIMSCTVLFGELALENSIYFGHCVPSLFLLERNENNN